MPRYRADDEDWAEEEDNFADAEDDFDDADGDEVGDEPDFIDCPYCGKRLHEDAQRCHHCDRYLSEEDAPPAPKPRWMILLAALCLLSLLFWIISCW